MTTTRSRLARRSLHSFIRQFTCRMTFRDEAELQGRIAQLLQAAGVAFERERVLSPGDRVDFLVLPGLGVEVKVGGPRTAIIRQLARYAAHDIIQGLVLVTASLRHTEAFPREIGGKSVGIIVKTNHL